jgi:hypothetical protein
MSQVEHAPSAAGSGGTVSFKYDPFGRRIYKSSSTGTSIYAYDGDNLIEETNASGATSYYQADGLGGWRRDKRLGRFRACLPASTVLLFFCSSNWEISLPHSETPQ